MQVWYSALTNVSTPSSAGHVTVLLTMYAHQFLCLLAGRLDDSWLWLMDEDCG